MVELDYAKLSRQQKLAVFLIVIGPAAAAEVLKQFDDAAIEMLCREMSTFTIVPAAAQKQALEEFSGIVAASASCALGGLAYAQRTLEIELVGEIGKNVSRAQAKTLYRVLRDERTA